MKRSLSKTIFSSPIYPRLPQAFVMGLFVYILLALIWGPENPKENIGTVLVWILWWPLIPLSFVFLARAWCALCPWGAISDWLQSYFSFALPVPKWIKKYGIWVIFGGFMFLTWYELAYGLTNSGLATAIVLLAVLSLALITSLLFERRIWCRYLCPLGGIFGNYSQTAIVEFRGDKEKCANCKDFYCYRGNEKAPGCALYEFPKVMDSNRLCNLCGDCVKSCENDSPSLKVRLPGKELWEKKDTRLDEAVLASTLVGFILISGYGMLEAWHRWQQNIIASTGISKVLFISLSFIAFAVITLLVSLFFSKISSIFSKEKTIDNFKKFGYALIPLNLMTHIAHNAFHFLGEGKNIVKVISANFSTEPAEVAAKAAEHSSNMGTGANSPTLVSMGSIQILQFILMAAGIAASIYVAYKIAQNIAEKNKDKNVNLWKILTPHLLEIAVFSILSFLMFLLPMAMRH